MKMPILFVGHGSPMNAIEDNSWSRGFRALAGLLPEPKAILSISAHWYLPGTCVTGGAQPKTIHDFGGFPDELFQMQYPAPGSVALAARVESNATDYRQLPYSAMLRNGTIAATSSFCRFSK